MGTHTIGFPSTSAGSIAKFVGNKIISHSNLSNNFGICFPIYSLSALEFLYSSLSREYVLPASRHDAKNEYPRVEASSAGVAMV